MSFFFLPSSTVSDPVHHHPFPQGRQILHQSLPETPCTIDFYLGFLDPTRRCVYRPSPQGPSTSTSVCPGLYRGHTNSSVVTYIGRSRVTHTSSRSTHVSSSSRDTSLPGQSEALPEVKRNPILLFPNFSRFVFQSGMKSPMVRPS